MAISILLSWLLSIPLFGLKPTPLFVLGLALVLLSVLLFSAAAQPHAHAHAHAAPPAAARQQQRRSGVSERGNAGWASWLEGDNVVLAALLTGVALGLLVGVVAHSTHAGGAGWAAPQPP